jgi:hypothetical protein
MELDWTTQRLPLLTPSPLIDHAAMLTASVGGLSSGERLTSVKGTDINRMRIDAKGQMLGVRIVSTNLGDDTTVSSDDPSLEKKWFDSDRFAGFTEERAPDVSFLMRRMPKGYAYLSRMVLMTINREVSHEPHSVLQAAAGIHIRHSLLRGHPAAAAYLRILLDSPSPHIRDAAAISQTGSTEQLLRAITVQARRPTAAEWEHVSEMWATAGLQLPTELAQIGARHQMNYSELRDTSAGISRRDASRALREWTYTV